MWRSGGIAPFYLNMGTRWRYEAFSTPKIFWPCLESNIPRLCSPYPNHYTDCVGTWCILMPFRRHFRAVVPRISLGLSSKTPREKRKYLNNRSQQKKRPCNEKLLPSPHPHQRTALSVQRLATSWTVRGSNLGGSEIISTRPHRPWGQPSLLWNGYRVSFPGVNRPGRGVNHVPPSSADVKEIVELYLHTPSGSLWPLPGRTLPFYTHPNLDGGHIPADWTWGYKRNKLVHPCPELNLGCPIQCHSRVKFSLYQSLTARNAL
jgi:hypothetical protein